MTEQNNLLVLLGEQYKELKIAGQGTPQDAAVETKIGATEPGLRIWEEQGWRPTEQGSEEESEEEEEETKSAEVKPAVEEEEEESSEEVLSLCLPRRTRIKKDV